MKVAVCGSPSHAQQMQTQLSDIEFKYFISELTNNSGGGVTNLPPISFFQFRRLVNAGELDGIIIAENARNNFTKSVIKTCKLYEIPQVGVIDLTFPNPNSPIYWLDTDKAYIAYLNTNIVDGCNLNCKGCTHFAAFFKRDEIYPFEIFHRDILRLSQICDVVSFRLCGGEPLLLKNLHKYIKITRRHFPKSNLGIVTNGLLLPSTSQKVLDALRENNFKVYVTVYPPTLQVLDKIKSLLEENKISNNLSRTVQNFGVFLTLHSGNDANKSRKFCAGNDPCRFLRDGKIYKCPPDALNYRFMEHFKVKGFPKSTGVNLYAPNFPAVLNMLDGNVAMCNWCSEQQTRQISWEPSNKNPKLEDWLADPDELKNFL